MSVAPSSQDAISLIYGGHSLNSLPEDESEGLRFDLDSSVERTSMYVKLFEDMIKEVLYYESHLFIKEEIGYLKTYNKLSYNARFVLVRLCLRKSEKWFRTSDLEKYRSELGDGMQGAMDELCLNAKLELQEQRKLKMKLEEDSREIIEISDDEQSPAVQTEQTQLCVKTENDVKLEPGPSNIIADCCIPTILAKGEDHAELPELLECLTADELRGLVKSMKAGDPKNKKRADLIRMLLDNSSKQSTLAFRAGNSKVKAKKRLRQNRMSLSQDQSARLRHLTMQFLGKCIQINSKVIEVLQRLQIVYYRCTEFSPDVLTPSILVGFKKRDHAEYEYKRTPSIWPDRDALLDYERALKIEYQINQILAGQHASSAGRGRSSTAYRTPVRSHEHSSAIPSTSASIINAASSIADTPDSVRTAESHQESPSVQGAKLIVAVFQPVYEDWKCLHREMANGPVAKNGLERFECGHVLTRIVCKGAEALAVLHEYDDELQVLTEMLSQRRWRRAKRGDWHNRRALILTKDLETLYAAKEAAEEGINDPDTHIIGRPRLQKRLRTLEKRLKIPPELRFVCTGELRKSGRVDIIRERIPHSACALKVDKMGRPVGKMRPPPPQWQSITKFFASSSEGKSSDVVIQVQTSAEKAMGKSIWRGRKDEEVSVETVALQYYEDVGYKGFHCEGSALYTIFGLLFWDIIFAPIAGAFETRFQLAPLDIAHETFYSSRQDIIQDRLKEIRDGKAAEILGAADSKYREKKTCCVGVRWDDFERQDLLDLVDCLGSSQLAEVCGVIAEDYVSRRSGLPDLLIWDITKEEKRCMFVEVKGPGDRLQENQKVWMDVLVRADVPVEVCHVQDKNEPKKPQKVKKPKKRTRTRDSDSERRNEPESEEQGPSTKRHALKRQKLHTPSPPENAPPSGSPEV